MLKNNIDILTKLQFKKQGLVDLTRNKKSIAKKLEFMRNNMTILSTTSSGNIGKLFRSNQYENKMHAMTSLQKMGISGQTLGLILQSGDSEMKVNYVEALQNMGISGQALGLILQSGNTEMKNKQAQALQIWGFQDKLLD